MEYWDIEKKRNPQYDHVAVLIAEDITARFFNVISLFNGVVPIIALQVKCVEMEGKLESPDFSPGSDAENIQSIKVLSFGNEFREVMAVRVNQEKFRKGIA